MLSSGVKADNVTDVIPASWKLGLVAELSIDILGDTQTYFNILQGLIFQGKDSVKYFALNHEMQDCSTLGKQNFLV